MTDPPTHKESKRTRACTEDDTRSNGKGPNHQSTSADEGGEFPPKQHQRFLAEHGIMAQGLDTYSYMLSKRHSVLQRNMNIPIPLM